MANTANLLRRHREYQQVSTGLLLARVVRMTSIAAEVNHLTERIIGCAIEVHRILGAGLLESAYRECMMIELSAAHLSFDTERNVKLDYKGRSIGSAFRLDLLIEKTVIVELKAIDCVHPVHLSQVITYLKLTGCPVGLLINFNVSALRNGVRRLEHPDLYMKRSVGAAPRFS